MKDFSRNLALMMGGFFLGIFVCVVASVNWISTANAADMAEAVCPGEWRYETPLSIESTVCQETGEEFHVVEPDRLLHWRDFLLANYTYIVNGEDWLAETFSRERAEEIQDELGGKITYDGGAE